MFIDAIQQVSSVCRPKDACRGEQMWREAVLSDEVLQSLCQLLD